MIDKIAGGTKVIIKDYLIGKEYECTILAHNVSFDAAVVIFDGDTDNYHMSNFSNSFVRIS